MPPAIEVDQGEAARVLGVGRAQQPPDGGGRDRDSASPQRPPPSENSEARHRRDAHPRAMSGAGEGALTLSRAASARIGLRRPRVLEDDLGRRAPPSIASAARKVGEALHPQAVGIAEDREPVGPRVLGQRSLPLERWSVAAAPGRARLLGGVRRIVSSVVRTASPLIERRQRDPPRATVVRPPRSADGTGWSEMSLPREGADRGDSSHRARRRLPHAGVKSPVEQRRMNPEELAPRGPLAGRARLGIDLSPRRQAPVKALEGRPGDAVIGEAS